MKLIDIITLNIVMLTRTMDLVWMSHRGSHMFLGPLPEHSLPKFSHIARLSNN